MPPLAIVMVGAGWLMVCGLSFACFRACRADGDHTPQGRMGRGMAFVAGVFFAFLALMPLAEVIQHLMAG